MNYYYKSQDGKAFWCLKEPNQPKGSIELTEEQWKQEIETLKAERHNKQ